MKIKKVLPGNDPCKVCKTWNKVKPCHNDKHPEWSFEQCLATLRMNEFPDFKED